MTKDNVVSSQEELTPQQAADLLCVSILYFLQLLDEGKILCHNAGDSRRVKTADVLAYIKEYQQGATQAMRELVAESQALGLYE